MEILNSLAQQFITDTNANGKIDISEAVAALQNLLSDSNGKIDLGSMVSNLQAGGLSEMVGSWLGDGENSPISTEQISSLFNSEQLSQFASALNLDVDNVSQGLTNIIPAFIDQMSSGGSLMDLVEGEIGDVGGIVGKIKGLLS